MKMIKNVLCCSVILSLFYCHHHLLKYMLAMLSITKHMIR